MKETTTIQHSLPKQSTSISSVCDSIARVINAFHLHIQVSKQYQKQQEMHVSSYN
jgi:hypothetical protein